MMSEQNETKLFKKFLLTRGAWGAVKYKQNHSVETRDKELAHYVIS